MVGLQNRVAKKFAEILHLSVDPRSKSGIMRGFQKGITLGGRPPGSACKVPGAGGGWWSVAF